MEEELAWVVWQVTWRVSLDVRPYLLLFGDSLRYVSFFFSGDLFRFVRVRKRKNRNEKIRNRGAEEGSQGILEHHSLKGANRES